MINILFIPLLFWLPNASASMMKDADLAHTPAPISHSADPLASHSIAPQPTPDATTIHSSLPVASPIQTAAPNPATMPDTATTSAPPTATVTASAPTNTPKPLDKSDIAFKALLDNALPLSPAQIEELHRLYDMTQQAAAAPPSTPPTPTSSSLVVNLEPGSQPPIIRLSAGFVSSLVFLDATGAPWPIVAYGLGDPNTFNIQWDEMSNALFLQSLKPYAHGNLAVRLADLNTPVMISLVSGQKEVDYRIDLQIAGRGPKAEGTLVSTALNSAQTNPTLIHILDGIPPEGSQQLTVEPAVAQVWLKQNKLYVRTALTLLSPAWTATVASANGTRVYEMTKTPLLLASQDGKTITVEIKGL